MDTERLLVSIVVPVMNEAPCVEKLCEELRRHCDPLPYDFEFLFVDDGSTDETVPVLAALHRRDPRVRVLVLSRNFGHQAALSAGLAYAEGAAVITMDGDLQHPPELIPTLLERWQSGFDLVNTIRVDTAQISPLKKGLSDLFYRFFNWVANVQIKPGGADFRLMSRAMVDALNDMPERHRFLRGLIPWLGFRQTDVPFSAPPRFAGKAKYNFARNIRFALDGITSFSFYPLRRLMGLGLTITTLSFLYGAWSIFVHFVYRTTVQGWTSLIVCVLFLGGCQLMALAAIAEYVGRVLEQVKGRPIFIVREAVGKELGRVALFEAPGMVSRRGPASRVEPHPDPSDLSLSGQEHRY
mgnify:CR=1 FL=1